MKSKKLLISYLILLHLVLFVLVFKTDFISKVETKLGFLPEELSPFYHDMVATHMSMDGNLSDQTIVFIGDSITQGLAVSAVATPSVNYGIGLDTSYGVLQRISQYKSLHTAKAVVLAIGHNDLKRRSNTEMLENYHLILQKIPKHTPLVVSAILPIDERVETVADNARIRDINKELKRLVKQFPNAVFMDAGEKLQDSSLNLATEYHTGDGIHLNHKGYEAWIGELKKTL